MGWLIALAVLVLLAVMPLGVSAKYDDGGPGVSVIAGFLRIPLLKKKKTKKEKPEKKVEAKPATGAKKKQSSSGGSITDFFPLIETALDFLGEFITRRLRLNRLEVKIIMAGDDPCDLATNYGRAWAAIGNLVPQLERFFVIKKRDLQVECDFTAEKTLIFAHLELTITLGRLVRLAVVYGIKLLRQYLNIQKSRKGGATK